MAGVSVHVRDDNDSTSSRSEQFVSAHDSRLGHATTVGPLKAQNRFQMANRRHVRQTYALHSPSRYLRLPTRVRAHNQLRQALGDMMLHATSLPKCATNLRRICG
eukprot:1058869-Pleurochrysis_carterae.AAC.1